MELLALEVAGFRRFKEPSRLQLNGKLVAILGPNEAGKSSLLKALGYLDHDDPIARTDFTRDQSAEKTYVTGEFFLSATETEEAGLIEPSWMVVHKAASGKRTFSIRPQPPTRDLRLRKSVRADIVRASSHKDLLALDADEDELPTTLDRLLEVLNSEKETLNAADLGSVESGRDYLVSILEPHLPKYIKTIPESLSRLVEYESDLPPSERALRHLIALVPPILFFDEDSRDLRSSYSLADVATDPPLALAQLAGIAELDLLRLLEAYEREDTALVRTIERRANEVLRQRFAETWSQADVHVSFALQGDMLEILIVDQGQDFTKLAERSDGLRQFVALQGFTTCKRAINPILLIDEAEQRLHYDAQADLVQMLTKQQVSNKVIYTTHSAGCLPEDLGNGVRLAEPVPETATSRVRNRFWDSNDIGFSPLLYGMGASTLAFFPTRRALVVEGEADLLLLPTMLREAHGQRSLGFQVVPGLSKASNSGLSSIFGSTGGVAYFVDGDAGGRELSKNLVKGGVSPERVFSLAMSSKEDCELEDFIDWHIIRAALAKLIDKFPPRSRDKISAAFAESSKMAEVKSISKTHRVEISRVNLAYEILDVLNDNPSRKVLDNRRRRAFIKSTAKLMGFYDSV